MLAGKANAMDIRVFKAETITDLWGDYPIVFRLVMLPFIVAGVLHHRQQHADFGMVNLGTKGEKIDLVNDHLLISGDDPEGMTTAAYAAESVMLFGDTENSLKYTAMTIIITLQTIVWCLQGADVELITLGERGGELPEWVWEPVQQGPRITNIRIKSFDEPSLPDE